LRDLGVRRGALTGSLAVWVGSGIVVLALVDRVWGLDPLLSFWIILLVGIAVAIFALWSILYRPSPPLAADTW
jgi:hypothetical protein